MALTVCIGLEPYIEIQNTISNDVGNEILGLTMAMRIKVGLNLTSTSKIPFLTMSEMTF